MLLSIMVRSIIPEYFIFGDLSGSLQINEETHLGGSLYIQV